MTVQILSEEDVAPEHLVVVCLDAESREVKFDWR